tara:strand:- start:158 stop:541 length:384 start_codon:yes stop_codon:yes gene_type:complete
MPAILYIGFTLTHIIIDLFNKLYNTAILKFVLMIIFTTMLDLLCKSGLTVISWIIVFLPFILLTAITILLLFSLGLSPDKGFLKYEVKTDNDVNPLDNDVNPLDNDVNREDDIELTTNVAVENMFNM